jgi:hypothetical protein
VDLKNAIYQEISNYRNMPDLTQIPSPIGLSMFKLNSENCPSLQEEAADSVESKAFQKVSRFQVRHYYSTEDEDNDLATEKSTNNSGRHVRFVKE